MSDSIKLMDGKIFTTYSAMFPGLKVRLSKELIAMVPEGVEVKVVAPPERRYSIWIGGSILASLKTFGKMWVTKK